MAFSVVASQLTFRDRNRLRCCRPLRVTEGSTLGGRLDPQAVAPSARRQVQNRVSHASTPRVIVRSGHLLGDFRGEAQ